MKHFNCPPPCKTLQCTCYNFVPTQSLSPSPILFNFATISSTHFVARRYGNGLCHAECSNEPLRPVCALLVCFVCVTRIPHFVLLGMQICVMRCTSHGAARGEQACSRAGHRGCVFRGRTRSSVQEMHDAAACGACKGSITSLHILRFWHQGNSVSAISFSHHSPRWMHGANRRRIRVKTAARQQAASAPGEGRATTQRPALDIVLDSRIVVKVVSGIKQWCRAACKLAGAAGDVGGEQRGGRQGGGGGGQCATR